MNINAFASPLFMVVGTIVCIMHDGMHRSLFETLFQAHGDVA
jgi:hypothetical protein